MSFKNRIMGRFLGNSGFDFSIVIAVYNAEKYLDETIGSVLNQSFDFNRVQVILVDDGSLDASADICRDYAERYPDNFTYVHQENQGQSAARNKGLDYVEGDFVNFLDSDDKLEPEVLKEVYEGFKRWGEKIDVISVPRYSFGRVSEPLPFYDKYLNSRVVDVLREYDFPQVSASASFIKSEAITQKFNTDLVISEDSLFLNSIILEKCGFGVVPSRYLYRKRDDEDSTIDTRKSRKEYFSTRIELYMKEMISQSLDRYGEVLRYVQSLLIYDLYWLLIQNSEIGVLDSKETERYYSDIRDVFQYVDDDIILSQGYRKSLKYHMLSVKYGNYDFTIKNDYLQFKNSDYDRLSNYMIFITDIRKDKDSAEIEFYYEFYPIDFSIVAYADGRPFDVAPSQIVETKSMSRTILAKYCYSISLPVGGASSEISFRRRMNGNEYDIRIRHEDNADEHIEIDDYKIILN